MRRSDLFVNNPGYAPRSPTWNRELISGLFLSLRVPTDEMPVVSRMRKIRTSGLMRGKGRQRRSSSTRPLKRPPGNLRAMSELSPALQEFATAV